MKRFCLFFILIIAISVLSAQEIKYGPAVGAITDHSARIFVRPTGADSIRIRVYSDTTAGSVVELNGMANLARDTTFMEEASGLSPATQYYYSVEVNGLIKMKWGKFRTFPSTGSDAHFTLGFGSCMYPGHTDSVFLAMAAEDLDLFLQVGDWGYYDQATIFPPATDFFCMNYETVVASWESRYSALERPNFTSFIQSLPMDYIYDNHDYMYTWSTRNSSTHVDYSTKTFTEYPNPIGCRENSKKGYFEHFPHYPLADSSEGIYHSFTVGNAEFFVVDNRSCRSPLTGVFTPTGIFGSLEFDPPADYRMLGQKQFNWLLNGLRSSDATWKFIVSGVPFNKEYLNFLNVALLVQDLTLPGLGSGLTASVGIAHSSWAGFPTDQDSLLLVCQEEEIRNVICLSGDTHTSGIDDGGNAGFPELLAGNLGITNSQALGLIQANSGIELYNCGGQGLGNDNYNEAFGKVEIFGSDSVSLNIVDKYGVLVASKTILNTDTGTVSRSPHIAQALNPFQVYPQPAVHSCRIVFEPGFNPSGIIISELNGKILRQKAISSSGKYDLDLSSFAQGMYLLSVKSNSETYSQLLMISD